MLGALTLKLGGLDVNAVLLTNGGVGCCSSMAEHLSLSDKGRMPISQISFSWELQEEYTPSSENRGPAGRAVFYMSTSGFSF